MIIRKSKKLKFWRQLPALSMFYTSRNAHLLLLNIQRHNQRYNPQPQQLANPPLRIHNALHLLHTISILAIYKPDKINEQTDTQLPP